MSVQNAPTELKGALQALRPFYAKAAGFAMVAALLLLVPTVYMLEVYDRVVNSRSHMTLAMLTLGVVLAYVIMEVLEWAKSETLREAGALLDRRIAPRVFAVIYEARLKRLPVAAIQPMNDFRTIKDFVNSPVVGAVMESPVSLVFGAILFAMNPWLGVAAVAGAVVQVGLAWLNEKSTNPPLTAANRAAIQAQQYADNSLRNAEVIESMGMLQNIHRRWNEKQREFLGLQAQASDSAGAFQAGTKLVQTTMSSLLLGLAAWLLLNNSLASGGYLIMGSVLGGRMLAPLVTMVSQWRSVVGVRDAWGRLAPLLQQLPPRDPAMPLPPPKGRLLAENLMVAAPGTQTVLLRGIQFALQPGEVLAVVGPSAAGKSTLARVLVGLWPSGGGKVRLDGVDVFTWDKAELGPHVGYLPQGVELLEGSIAENIARFGQVNQRQVEEAARAVGLHEFISALPLGYDSPVGRDGARLSGGQRQRVALARAIYGDPVFVVLDEPNASLDEVGDAALAQTIRALKARGTTFVVMTHRTSVLAVTDKMLVLRDGAQQAFGPRDEVMAALSKGAQQAQGQPRAGLPVRAPATQAG